MASGDSATPTARTPIKKTCIICDKEMRATHMYGVGKRTWLNENLGAQVFALAGEDVMQQIEQSEGSLCQHCKMSLTTSYTFQTLLKGFTPRAGSKRMPKTPLQAQTDRPVKKSKAAGSKKRLFDVSPSTSSSVTSVSVDDLSSPPDNAQSSTLVIAASPSSLQPSGTSEFVIPKRPTPTTHRARGTENVDPQRQLTDNEKQQIIALTSGPVDTLISVMMTIPLILQGVKENLINTIHNCCAELSKLKRPSCLRQRDMETLKKPQFFGTIYQELKSRNHFLFQVLGAAVSPIFGSGETEETLMGPLVMVYAVLLFKRNNKLSAFQRAMSLLMTKGSATEECVSAFNKLGITLSFKHRLAVMDECVAETAVKAKQLMRSCPFCNLVGDNCDIRVRPRHVSLHHQVKDCHFFGMLLIFSRMANEMQKRSNAPPSLTPANQHLNPDNFILSSTEQKNLLKSYKVMIMRMMVKNFPAFKWMEDVLPVHIPHTYQEQMSKQSSVIPVKLILRNEAKYEDCVWILHEARELLGENFEDEDNETRDGHLDGRKTPFFGDQLTRERLQRAKGLRRVVEPIHGSFEDLGPFFCTLWHVKQDFLEKCYKLLWKTGTAGDRGSLMFFKNFLRTSYVNGKVKNNYRAHEQLFLIAGEFYLMEQVMEHFKMDTYESWPEAVQPNITTVSSVGREVIANNHVMKYLRRYGYAAVSDPAPEAFPDYLMQYANNLGQRALHLMHLNDMAKEGDLDRCILSLKANVPFFFSHSTKSKYFVECLDMLQKTLFTCSPQMRLRLLEGSFTNKHGGRGRNVETDLVMEHSVRAKKDLIRSLGANKRDGAIERITMSAETIADIAKNISTSLNIPRRSAFSTKVIYEEDETRMKECLRNLRPFTKQPGRKLGKIRVPATSITRPLMDKMKVHMQRTLTWLYEKPHQAAEHTAVEDEAQPDNDEVVQEDQTEPDYESDHELPPM